METKETFAASLEFNWPYCLALIPILAAWICDRNVPSDMRSTIVNAVSGLLTLALVAVIQHQRQELEGVSITDQLTGVHNARYLKSELDRQVFLAQRAQLPLSLIFIDVDDLKSVNDRYGHMVGNSVLRQLGRGLNALTRQHMDLCFRFGGDEFVVLCPHTDLETAKEIAERVQGIPNDDPALKSRKITLSLGLIQLRAAESSGDFLKRADRAMYYVKQNGKNGIGLDPAHRLVRPLVAHEQ
jgi:diguanylate cyclase (GGDEF)-like protein